MDHFNSPNAQSLAVIRPKRAGRAGQLFKRFVRVSEVPNLPNREALPKNAAGRAALRDPYRLAFAGLWLFTLLLYVRPNELFPALGDFPLVRIVSILGPLAYVYARVTIGKPIIHWTLEVKMVCLMVLLALLFAPMAISIKESFDTLIDLFIKVVIVFILLVGIIDTRERLRSMIKLTLICGTVIALFAIISNLRGEFAVAGNRIEGIVGGIFGNPNDLATALNMLLPLAILFALTSSGLLRLFYIACALIQVGAILVTYSRGGFLGLVAATGVMVWKYGRGRRLQFIFAAILILSLLIIAAPGGYGSRLITIFYQDQDQYGSAQDRRNLLAHGITLALRRPYLGLGMGNFHIYSLNEKAAHNAYVEVAVELSTLGLAAYLILIFSPIRGLRRIEHETSNPPDDPAREIHYFSIALQAVLAAYIVCSFFASIQYLWYIYYAAGYAIALRQIHAEEQSLGKSDLVSTVSGLDKKVRIAATRQVGTLLKSRPRGSLWLSGNLRKKFQ